MKRTRKRINDSGFTTLVVTESDPKLDIIIAEVLFEANCLDMATYEKGVYKLKCVYLDDYSLIIENSCYLIFKIEDSIDYVNRDYVNNKTNQMFLENDKFIFVQAIYSFKSGEGDGQKAIDKLLSSSDLPVLIDTYTKELIHLSLKNNLFIFRKSSFFLK